MAKRLRSVFTDDMDTCFFTGSTQVHRHHIFYGEKCHDKSEKYGFIVPVRYDLHNMSKNSIHDKPNRGLDLQLKQMAQTYYEHHIGSREDFRQEFGKSWL